MTINVTRMKDKFDDAVRKLDRRLREVHRTARRWLREHLRKRGWAGR